MISKRALKCLKRIDAGKSIPDIGAMDELEEQKLIVCTYGDGEMSVLITDDGKKALDGDAK